MLDRLKALMASREARPDVKKPDTNTPFDELALARAGANTPQPDAWTPVAVAALTRLIDESTARAGLDVTRPDHIAAIAVIAFAAGIPLQTGLERCGREVGIVGLLQDTLRGLLKPHHTLEVRQEPVTRVTGIFRAPRQMSREMKKATETIGNMSLGWYTTGDPTYLDAIADQARRVQNLL